MTLVQRLVHIFAGTLWGLLVFMGGLHLFFPGGPALERLRYELSQRSNQVWSLTATDVDLWRLTGLRFEDLKVYKSERTAPKPTVRRTIRKASEDLLPEEEALLADEDATVEELPASEFFSAGRAAFRLRLLPLILGRLSASFDVDVAGGSAIGTLTRAPSAYKLALRMEDLDVKRLPLKGKTLDLDLLGMLTGHIDLDLSEADPTRSTGEGELVFRDLRLEGGRFSGLEINQKGRFDKAELRFTVADGKARVEQGVIEGDVLHAKLEGEITLSKKLSRSRLRIPVVFTVSEELDKLLALVPGAKDAKDEDGAWHYLLSGTVEHPRFKPDRVRRGGVASPARGPRVPGDVEPPLRGGGPALLDREDAGGPERPDAGKMSPEERRKLREERMRERRERMRARREGGDGALTPDERRARRLPPDNDDELDDLPGEPEYPRVQNFEPPRPPEDREFRQSPPDDDEPLPPPKGQYYEEFEQ